MSVEKDEKARRRSEVGMTPEQMAELQALAAAKKAAE